MDELLVDLDEQQRAAAEHLVGPLVVLAGAGTGKTRTVTRRIAHGVATGVFDPRRTMALTFTTSAAAELGRRLEQLGAGQVAARTFHSAALRQLRYFWPSAVGGPMARIVADKRPVVAAALRGSGVAPDPGLVRTFVSEIERCKAINVTPDSYQRRVVQGRADQEQADQEQADQGHASRDRTDQVRPGRVRAGSAAPDPALFPRVFRAYEDEKSRDGVIDFEDVLLVTIGLLEARSDLREEVRRNYRWFTVDEFQDVSPLQMRLLDLWLGRSAEICVVGDPAQSIYRFAGADRELLTGFGSQFPGARVVRLQRSYRCSTPIVAAANRIAEQIPGALDLTAESQDPAPPVQVLSFPDEGAEARGVAEEIAALIRAGQDPGSIACLYRTHQQSEPLRAELQLAGVPFAARAGERFFRRPEVRESVTRLRGQARITPDSPSPAAVAEVMTAMGVATDSTAPKERDQLESFRALLGLAEDFPELREFVDELERREAVGLAPPPNAVTLLTLHAAKGLEWQSVFIIGMVEGRLPLLGERGAADLDEEYRLFYVGITRALRRLVLTWPRQRARSSARAYPSRFLSELREAATQMAEPRLEPGSEPVVTVRVKPRPADPLPPAACRVCGKGLVTGRERVLGRCRGCPSQADPALLATLLDWIDRTAAERGVPRSALLTAAAAERLVAERPGTLAELAELPGMTSRKVSEHGSALLELLGQADL